MGSMATTVRTEPDPEPEPEPAREPGPTTRATDVADSAARMAEQWAGVLDRLGTE
jgi:hypothetical protein